MLNSLASCVWVCVLPSKKHDRYKYEKQRRFIYGYTGEIQTVFPVAGALRSTI